MIPALGTSPGSDATPEPPARSRTVLILDEAAPVQRLLKEILTKLGVPASDIRACGDPEEALRIFLETRPHVVFAEFIGVHPDEGLDMIHAMLDAAPEAKIILLTAETRDAPEVRAALRAGVFAHVEKPLRHDKIRAVMAELESEEGGIERFR